MCSKIARGVFEHGFHGSHGISHEFLFGFFFVQTARLSAGESCEGYNLAVEVQEEAMYRYLKFLILIILLTACAPTTALPTSTPTAAFTLTPSPFPTATVQLAEAATATPTAPELTAIQPETVGCASKETCYGIEPKDPAALYKQATEALLMGPANQQYFEDFGLGKADYAARMAWLKASMHVNPTTGQNEGYWLPDKSPKGTEFVILQNDGQEFGQFHTSVAMQKNGGMRLDDIQLVVFGPDAYKENRGGVKDLYDQMIAENTNFNGAYGPLFSGGVLSKAGEVYGLSTINDGEKLVFVAADVASQEQISQAKYPSHFIGGAGSDTCQIVSAMWNTFFETSATYTRKTLEDTGLYFDVSFAYTPGDPPVVTASEDPTAFVGPKALFEPAR